MSGPRGSTSVPGAKYDARWLYAPTGRKGIAQGKAKRRPGFGTQQKSLALKGRNEPTGKPMRDVPIAAAHRRRRHIQRTQGGAALYPGLSHYAPLGRTIRLRISVDCTLKAIQVVLS